MLSNDVDGNPFERNPLPGPVSNIASWNYPMSVQVHAELVQLLAGNAVVAKTPTQGGAITAPRCPTPSSGIRVWARSPSSAADPTVAASPRSSWIPASGTSSSRRA